MMERCTPKLPSGGADELASTESLPTLVGKVYDRASQPLRLKLLSLLLRPVGPLALVTLASGAFSSLLHRRTWLGAELSFDDAARFTGDHIGELARYVEQAKPELLTQIAPLVASDATSVGVLAVALLLHALRGWGTYGAHLDEE